MVYACRIFLAENRCSLFRKMLETPGDPRGLCLHRRTGPAARQRAQADGSRRDARLHPPARPRAGLSVRALRRLGRGRPVPPAVPGRLWRARRQRDRHGDRGGRDFAARAPTSTWRSPARPSARSTSCARPRRSRSSTGCRGCSAARSGWRSRSPSRRPAPTSARCAPPRGATATTTSSTARSCGAAAPGAKNAVINVYVKTDTKVHYRQGMSLFLVDNDTPGRGAAQARHAGPPLHRHLRDLLQRRARAGRPADRRREQGLGLPHVRPAGRARVLGRRQLRRRPGGGRHRAAPTPRSASSSAARSARSRRSPTCWPTWRPRWRPPVTLMWRAAWMVASGQDALREISMAKLLSSETYAKVANLGMQILGGYGYTMEFDMQRHFRDSRGLDDRGRHVADPAQPHRQPDGAQSAIGVQQGRGYHDTARTGGARCDRVDRAALAGFLGVGGALAQSEYPDKPVRIVIDSAAGSANDATARILADKLSQLWRQQVVILNQPGAGGSISTRVAATAPADGYTLYMPATSPFLALPGAPGVAPNLPIELPRDFASISFILQQPLLHRRLPQVRHQLGRRADRARQESARDRVLRGDRARPAHPPDHGAVAGPRRHPAAARALCGRPRAGDERSRERPRRAGARRLCRPRRRHQGRPDQGARRHLARAAARLRESADRRRDGAGFLRRRLERDAGADRHARRDRRAR